MIKAVIVDDETGAQNTLIGMLGQFCPNVEIVGKSTTVNGALQLLEKHQPDLVFLDIRLSPTESGFDFIKRSGRDDYGIIFITAFSQFAVKAINIAQPWAYLVKPYSVDDLMDAVWTASKRLSQREKTINEEDSMAQSKILINDSRKGQFVLSQKQIILLSSGQSVIEIWYLSNNTIHKIHTYQTLKYFTQNLSEQLFCRVHHSYLINLEYVIRFEKNGRSGTAYMMHDIEIPVSIKKAEVFAQQLKLITKK